MSLGQGTENAIFVDVVFWVIAVSSIVCAIVVVQSKDLFRSAMFLIVSFLSVAGLFVLLRAEFLAAVQVLIYVGAIAVLLLFAILMTRDVESGNPSNRQIVPVGVLAALFGAAAIFVATSTEWTILDTALLEAPELSNGVVEVFSNTVRPLAELLIRDFVLAFEVASVLLLAAIIGALALVREG
ncbi:MAG: NADH-quinone oxidoreductase subunit J [Chloroflexota bacterium]|nr:NADH-quinone oxidoreductase subunit J [Chloroflexota bacterium]